MISLRLSGQKYLRQNWMLKINQLFSPPDFLGVNVHVFYKQIHFWVQPSCLWIQASCASLVWVLPTTQIFAYVILKEISHFCLSSFNSWILFLNPKSIFVSISTKKMTDSRNLTFPILKIGSCLQIGRILTCWTFHGFSASVVASKLSNWVT